VGYAQGMVWYFSQWVVLFKGRYPAGMHGFVVGAMRWQLRVQAFVLGLRDEYPPFGLS